MSSISHKQGGFGEALKAARMRAGIDLRRLSDTTRIQIRYIEALEEEDWGSVPKGVIGRGFVRLISREIGADAADLLEKYRISRGEDPLAHLAQYSTPDEEMDMTYGKSKIPAFGRVFNEGALLPIGIGVVLLLVIGIGLWLWNPWADKEPGAQAGAKPAVEATAAVEPPKEAAAPPKEEAPPAEALKAPPVETPQPAAPAATGVLEVKALARSWIVVQNEGQESQTIGLAENETRRFDITRARLVFPGNGTLALTWNGAQLNPPKGAGEKVVMRVPEDAGAANP